MNGSVQSLTGEAHRRGHIRTALVFARMASSASGNALRVFRRRLRCTESPKEGRVVASTEKMSIKKRDSHPGYDIDRPGCQPCRTRVKAPWRLVVVLGSDPCARR